MEAQAAAVQQDNTLHAVAPPLPNQRARTMGTPAGPNTADMIRYLTAPIDNLVRNIQQDRIFQPDEFSCRICRENCLMNCHTWSCVLRSYWRSPIWRLPDGSLRPSTEAAYCLREHVAWRQFQDMFHLRNVDSRAACVLTMLVGPDVPASSYRRLVRKRNRKLFITIFLKRMLDAAPRGTRQQQRVVEVLCEHIRENYIRDYSGRELRRTRHFKRWLNEVCDKCYTLYSQLRTRQDQASARAASSGEDGKSTVGSAQIVVDELSQSILENYFRAHPGKEQHFEHWLDKHRNKLYVVYGKPVPHRDNISRLGDAAGSGGAGTSVAAAAAAPNVNDFNDEFIIKRVFDFWPVDPQEQGAAADQSRSD